jgi:O-antigen/teichoic acid export membrane protein
MIISVPLTIHYLGTERYALWMVISSSVAMLTFSDLGIGNGLLTAVSEAHGRGDESAASSFVASGFFMLSGIACLIIAVLVFGFRIIPWMRVFSVSSPQAVKEAGPAAAVFIFCFALGLPLGIVQRVENGYQDGFTNNIWNTLGNILSLIALIVAVKVRAGLPWLVLAITGVPLLAIVMNGISLFGFRRRLLLPRWTRASASHMKMLLSYGIYFFILQTCVQAATNIDNLIVAHLLGPTAVATYAVTMRMYAIVPTVLMMVLFPLWPAYGESIARGEIAWARRALARSLQMIFVFTAFAGVLLVVFGPWLLRVWVGKSLNASRSLLIATALWMMLSTGANAVSIFLNGAKKMRVQVLSAVGMCVLSVILKFVFAPRFGLAAVMWSTDIAYILMIAVPAALFVPKMLERMQSEAELKTERGSALEFVHDAARACEIG